MVCCCPSKGRTILPKVAFLATVVAPTVTLHTRASTPQMRSPTYIALHSTLLMRKTPRPLRLMVGPIIRSPPLLMPGLGPRWSADPLRWLWLLWALAFHLALHLLHHPGLLYQSGKVLDGQRSHHQADVTAEPVLELPASPLLIEWQGVETTEVFEPFSILCNSLPSLGQLEELHLLGVPDAVGKVLG